MLIRTRFDPLSVVHRPKIDPSTKLNKNNRKDVMSDIKVVAALPLNWTDLAEVDFPTLRGHGLCKGQL